MRTRISTERMKELVDWISNNPNATVREFVKKTGGKDSQFYKARIKAGLKFLNPVLSTSMKKVAKKKKAVKSITPPVQTVKDEVVIEGNTPDFIWYELDLMQRKLGDLITRAAHVSKVAQGRDADQKKMMRDLIQENTELRVNNNSLKNQVTELTEMINGTSV